MSSSASHIPLCITLTAGKLTLMELADGTANDNGNTRARSSIPTRRNPRELFFRLVIQRTNQRMGRRIYGDGTFAPIFQNIIHPLP